MTQSTWPVAELDRIQRMRALAAGLAHVALAETVIDAPFDAVWAIAGDLVNGVPRFEHDAKRVEILARNGDRLDLMTYGRLGIRMRFEACLQPGWCVMRSRVADIGMAAAPDGAGRTRFAHFEGSRWLGRAGRAYFAGQVRRDLAKQHPWSGLGGDCVKLEDVNVRANDRSRDWNYGQAGWRCRRGASRQRF